MLGQAPVCLFPTREMCKTFNNEMLHLLTTEVHELLCTDEVDQTSSTKKWNEKAIEQLEKLNNDCSRTAGLKAKFLLAVGARVMLRRNIDTKTTGEWCAWHSTFHIKRSCNCSIGPCEQAI